jgi:hypothetical protein
MRKPKAQAEAGLKDSENSGRGSTAAIVLSVAVGWLGSIFLTGKRAERAALTRELNFGQGVFYGVRYLVKTKGRG